MDAGKGAEGDKPAIEVDPAVTSRHFAELERRKAAIAAQEKRIAEQRKAEEPDRKAFEEFRRAREEAKKDPFKAFTTLGLTADDIALALTTAPPVPTETDGLKAELDAIKAELAAEKERKASVAANEAEARGLAIAKENIGKIIAEPEFAVVRKHGETGVKLILDVMEAHFEETKKQTGVGVIVPYKVAITHVAKHYAEVAAAAKAAEEESKAQQEAAAKTAPDPKDPKTAKAKDQAEKPVVISNKTAADTPPSAQPSDAAANKARAIRLLNDRMAAKRAAFASKGAKQ